MSKQNPPSSERRSFLSYLNGGVASLAALAVGSTAMAQDKPKATTRWEPARHDKDDWLDELPGKHRLVFDTTTAEGVGQALLFADNFMRVNRADYGLQDSDLAVVIVVRYRSAPFGFKDTMWAKYGTTLAQHSAYEDPATKTAPTVNVYNSPGRGTTLEALSKRGVQLAVCSSATRNLAGAIARASGGKMETDAVNAELIANLVSNGRMVPAGIVAVSRAQERGYSLVRA